MVMRLQKAQEFQFGDHMLRVVPGRDGEPWFVSDDVCAILPFGSTLTDLHALDGDEKGIVRLEVDTLATVSQVGLYVLIHSSPNPQAKAFKAWLSSVVLPWIHRGGAFKPQSKANAPVGEKSALGEDQATHIALNLAAPVLQRKLLVMAFDDIHNPEVRWVSDGDVIMVDTQQETWADDLMQRLSREQIAQILHAATRTMIG